ncbi:hypothetical protein Pcinc_007682 [Petrolisthes cinctipes]|uniref:Uncharacterized protein n=1 Tax=Petrolisthes cinctipes TaxID=88211 RepID=A0AAE1G8X5_PETCI|nr:hypothetical protein Pcinc_007682 [Petrolisthes cinctipes]
MVGRGGGMRATTLRQVTTGRTINLKHTKRRTSTRTPPGMSNQSTHIPTNQITNSPTNQPTSSPTNPPTYSPTKPPTNQPTYSPTNPPTNQATPQQPNQPTNKPTNPSTNQPTHQPPNQPTHQPPNQPLNQPTHQPPVRVMHSVSQTFRAPQSSHESPILLPLLLNILKSEAPDTVHYQGKEQGGDRRGGGRGCICHSPLFHSATLLSSNPSLTIFSSPCHTSSLFHVFPSPLYSTLTPRLHSPLQQPHSSTHQSPHQLKNQPLVSTHHKPLISTCFSTQSFSRSSPTSPVSQSVSQSFSPLIHHYPSCL